MERPSMFKVASPFSLPVFSGWQWYYHHTGESGMGSSNKRTENAIRQELKLSLLYASSRWRLVYNSLIVHASSALVENRSAGLLRLS